jgi:hypothetical protein
MGFNSEFKGLSTTVTLYTYADFVERVQNVKGKKKDRK